MKLYKSYIINVMLATMLVATFTACDDYLDKVPMSSVSPEVYFSSEAQLLAYLDDEYPNILPTYDNWTYGVFGADKGTDNQIEVNAASRFTTTQWKVDESESSNWNFERVYRMNYFLTEVLPKFGGSLDGSKCTISGDVSNIKHYIGEAYFLRAYVYFSKELLFGDFPIITEPLDNDMQVLAEASTRSPRNEVARFIIQDLDSAYLYMSDAEMATTRINKDLAMLLESRVALNEATWLQNFKGTAFVPGGTGWPGTEVYGTYTYPSGSIDNEINYFLDVAINASKIVAEEYKGKLTANTGVLQQSEDEPNNPYYDMFASEDLSEYPEVLLWQQHARSISTHNINAAAGRGNYRAGLTRGFVQNFLMADGTPVYTHGDYATGDGYYMGDQTIANVRQNRDTRLSIFLKEPGQKDVFIDMDNNEGTEIPTGENGENGVEPYPKITLGDSERGYATGYALHKGGSFDRKHYGNGGGYTAEVKFRAVEALLNYMEAYYLRYGNLDESAREYWTLIRQRAGVDTDFDKTISLTDMSKEAENDWGAYSGGELVDATLYNIRRERRCEYIGEGMRYMDLRRWRSMDQLINTPCHMEGFHLWNTPMQDWYDADDLIYDETSSATVSSPSKSEYLRPFEKNPTQYGYDGCTWRMAHYLYPIMAKQFQLIESAGLSNLYQNPYWPTTADMTAEQ
ncbi:MAG: RagB/SusD family nutrient uptake outer membrane protein [Prevotella sp.]|nr:RagB/SusD family nutrient uptake outer membrane protein [Prevotella sp.]